MLLGIHELQTGKLYRSKASCSLAVYEDQPWNMRPTAYSLRPESAFLVLEWCQPEEVSRVRSHSRVKILMKDHVYVLRDAFRSFALPRPGSKYFELLEDAGGRLNTLCKTQ